MAGSLMAYWRFTVMAGDSLTLDASGRADDIEAARRVVYQLLRSELCADALLAALEVNGRTDATSDPITIRCGGMLYGKG
jgi:hypothetical protein